MTASPGLSRPADPDPEEPLDRLVLDLQTSRDGLGEREVQRRRLQFGPNELTRRESSGHLRAFVAQLTHPLALLLWAAGALALVAGMAVLAVAIVVVIVLNAAFAFAQELQAEHATEALAQLLPPQARVRRGGRVVEVPAAELVPGDVLLLEEGDRLSADARLVAGEVRDPGNRPVAHLRALGAGRSRSR